MNNNFSKNLNNAIKRCDGMYVNDTINGFGRIYPFTTENIDGYLNNFELKDKSLLTVGSSADQVINAALEGCKDITLFDINPYTKYYYYLKIACLICLDKNDFINFLHYKDYQDNEDAFNINIFNQIKPTLRLLDYESYLFWNELFQSFKPLDIRSNLFELDEERRYVITKCNKYLHSDKLYNEAKYKLRKIKTNFIVEDISNISTDKTYDNIWLSNIGTHLKSIEDVKSILDKVSNLLNESAQVLICYLYNTKEETEYKDFWPKIYDLNNVKKIFKEYNPYFNTFTGVEGILFDNDIQDSILVYKKSTIR